MSTTLSRRELPARRIRGRDSGCSRDGRTKDIVANGGIDRLKNDRAGRFNEAAANRREPLRVEVRFPTAAAMLRKMLESGLI